MSACRNDNLTAGLHPDAVRVELERARGGPAPPREEHHMLVLRVEGLGLLALPRMTTRVGPWASARSAV